MAAFTLDKTRDFGEVHPPEDGAHFYQDGFYFGPRGDLVQAFLDDAARAKLAFAEAAASANAIAEKARADALKSAGFDPATQGPGAQAAPIPTPPVAEAISSGGVDLRAWLLGTTQYQFFAIVAATKELYGFSPATKAQAVDFLTSGDPQVGGPKLVSPDEVKA
jgi:hypothetical protein